MPTRKTSRRSTTARPRAQARSRNGSVDAIALLKKDHETVRGLLKKLEASNSRTARLTLLAQVEKEIKVHTEIEERIFYPAFREAVRSKDDKELYYEAIEEHHVVDMYMPEIKNSNADDETFPAKAKVLKDLIEHHAEEEETEMFPKARKVLNKTELTELGQQLQEMKDQMNRQQSWSGRKTRRAA